MRQQRKKIIVDTITTSMRTDAQPKHEADRIASDSRARGFANVDELFAGLNA